MGNQVSLFNGGASSAYNNPGAPPPLIPAVVFWGSPVQATNDGRLYCPGFDGETFASNPWDYIKFGTVYGNSGGAKCDRTPGICRINIGKGWKVDTKPPVGAHGSRNTFHGVKPAGTHHHHHGSSSMKHTPTPLDIEIEIWTPEQLRQLQTMWQLFIPSPGKGDPLNVDVSHPVFTFHDLKALQFVGGEGPTITSDRRGIFKIHAVEWLPPPKNSTTTSAVVTSVAPLSTAYDPPTPALPGSNPVDTGPRTP